MAVTTSTTPWYAGGGGVTTFSRAEAQSFARGILSSQAYRDKLRDRAERGVLPPAVETMLWHYAYGKPPEQIDVNVQEDLSGKSPAQLANIVENAMAALQRVKELEEAIDVVAKEVA